MAEREFEGRCTFGAMYVGVIRIRKQPQVHVPVVLMLACVFAQHRSDRLVVSLDLLVRLGMLC